MMDTINKINNKNYKEEQFLEYSIFYINESINFEVKIYNDINYKQIINIKDYLDKKNYFE